MSWPQAGASSDGLSTTALPATTAGMTLPERNGQRIVPRRDDGDDAERLMRQASRFRFRGKVLVCDCFVSEQARRFAGVILGGFKRDEDVGEERLGEGFAGLAGDQLRQFVAARVEHSSQLVE